MGIVGGPLSSTTAPGLARDGKRRTQRPQRHRWILIQTREGMGRRDVFESPFQSGNQTFGSPEPAKLGRCDGTERPQAATRSAWRPSHGRRQSSGGPVRRLRERQLLWVADPAVSCAR